MTLVIIEGIGKKDTIKKYLGSGYDVLATGGHFRDLPKSVLAVDVDNGYTPKYSIPRDKNETVKKIKDKAAKAKSVLIATDPDREGEAIGFHVAHILGLDPSLENRIAFNEITKKAVQEALQNPRTLDMDLFQAQQARRVLDRLVGYKLSPVVSKKIKKSKLSAGRVQSVTLKLVVLREREILAFVPEEYWDFFSHLEKDSVKFRATLHSGLDGKKIKLTNKDEVDAVVKAVDKAKYEVVNVKKSITKSNAPPPYTTSSMQQDALNKAGMSLKRCGMAAQALYEGVELGEHGKTALVTYIRTDSFRVSPEAQHEAKAWILEKYGADYAPETFNFYKSKKSAQDAHEAIRPTNIHLTPESVSKYLAPDQAKLYRLIYNRFLASQMTQATYDSVSVDIAAGGYGFRATGRVPIFLGWTVLYQQKEKSSDEEGEEKEEFVKLPNLEVGDTPEFLKLEFTQKFTKPPARYTEATLVKAMEEAGIGRPATYNPIIQNIANRYYTEKEGKSIKPTELGFAVVDLLDKYFKDIMNIEFTAGLEEKLDDIAYEGLDWVKVIDEFYQPFTKDIETAMAGEDNITIAQEVSDIECEKCGKLLVVRIGRFGKFYACPGFPACRNIKPYEKPLFNCPKCTTGAIYKKKSKKGRMFYGCGAYPNCDFVTWDEPTGKLCDKCKSPIVTDPKSKQVKCSSKECT
ncbi:MAG: type I DNA topoisomerase [Firmicutes bacterium]|nr:type I DNA topoisomerase [Bacillota bacterium]